MFSYHFPHCGSKIDTKYLFDLSEACMGKMNRKCRRLSDSVTSSDWKKAYIYFPVFLNVRPFFLHAFNCFTNTASAFTFELASLQVKSVQYSYNSAKVCNEDCSKREQNLKRYVTKSYNNPPPSPVGIGHSTDQKCIWHNFYCCISV